MQRRHARVPPLQRSPKPQTRPEGHVPVVVHSSASGVNASQRIVVRLQKLLPEHAYLLQHGWPVIPHGGRPPSTGTVSIGGVVSVGDEVSVCGTSGCVTSGCSTSGVVASTTTSVPLSLGLVTQVAAPPCTTHDSVEEHAGLHADTQVPDTQVNPSRHAGVHVAGPG